MLTGTRTVSVTYVRQNRSMAGNSLRLLDLLSLLQTGRGWTGAQLADRLGVTIRTIRRDVDRLREFGYPVEATAGSIGGYRLMAGTAMPPLLLDDEEAVAIAVGLRTSALHAVVDVEDASVRALAKLDHVLPSRLRTRVRAIARSTSPLLDWQRADLDPDVLSECAGATSRRERLRFRYVRNDEEERRHVEPHGLVSSGRRWYLVGFDHDRDDWRTFRVDRIRRPEPTGARFIERDVPGGDPAALVADRLRELNPVVEADVRVRLPVDPPPRLPAGVSIEPIDQSTGRLVGLADTVPFAARFLLDLDLDLHVVGPPELVDHLRRLAQRAQAVTDPHAPCVATPSPDRAPSRPSPP